MKKINYVVIACVFFFLFVSAGVYAQDQDERMKESEAFKNKLKEKLKEMRKRKASQDEIKDEITKEGEAYSKRLREISARNTDEKNKKSEELSKYKAQGRYYEVIANHKKELEKCNQGRIPSAYSNNKNGCLSKNHNQLGTAYKEIGFYEEALEHYLLGLKYGESHWEETKQTVGELRQKLEEQMLKSKSVGMPIAKLPKVPETSSAKGYSLQSIGKVYVLLGKYDEAIKYFQEASKISVLKNLEQFSPLDHNRDLSVETRKYLKPDQLAQLETSQKSIEPLNLLLKAQENLSLFDVYFLNSNYEEALRRCNESLKIIEDAKRINAGIVSTGAAMWEKNNPLMYLATQFDAVNKKGMIQFRMKNYSCAEATFLDAGKIFVDYKKLAVDEAKNSGARKLASSLIPENDKKRLPFSLVAICLATGRYQEALTRLNGIDIRGNDVLLERITYHTQRGEALSHLGQAKDASTECMKAVLVVEEAKGRLRKAQEGFLGAEDRVKPYRGLVSALAERALKGDLSDSSFSAYGRDLKQSTFYFAESTKARTLLDAMAASGRKTYDATIPKDLQGKEAMLAGELFAVEAEWPVAYAQGEAALIQLRQKKQQLSSELNTLIGQFRQDYPRYAALKYPSPFTADQLPLKANEVLIEYALGDDSGYAFIVRKGGVNKIIKIPIRKDSLEAKIQLFMQPMNPTDYSKFSTSIAKELYSLLLADALKEVKKTDKVIIVPDGILGLLPFESLIVKEGKDYRDSIYVGDRFAVTYAQSATVLALNRMLNPTKATRPVFALGNPFYSKDDMRYIAYKQGQSHPVLITANLDSYAFRGLATRREWGQVTTDDKEGKPLIYNPLPETEGEVRQIAGLFNTQPNPPDILLRINANETTFKQTPLINYRYLHFATHGDLPGKLQGINEPFLLLGQVENQGDDNGFLTLSKVLGLKIDADMVVLSACMTGRGKVMEGEGVVNFARAFQHAGARSVVVSLWEVASQETVEYMTTFYRYLKEGKSRSEALSLARGAIKKKYPNPFFWAPFVLYGEG